MNGLRSGGAGARVTSLIVALALTLPAVGHATKPPDPAVQESRTLYEEGTLSYDTSDYLKAVDAFTRAHRKAAKIEEDEQREHVMNTLLFNLARAHSRAYEVDQDASHLRKAKDLLRKYLAKEEDLGDELDAEVLLETTERRLAELETDGKRAKEAARPTAKAPTPADKPRISGLMIGGIATSVLGLGGLGVMVGGLVKASRAVDTFENEPTKRDDARDDNKLGNNLAIGAGVAGGVLLVTGAVLLALGARKLDNRMAVVPSGAGAAWEVRF